MYKFYAQIFTNMYEQIFKRTKFYKLWQFPEIITHNH